MGLVCEYLGDSTDALGFSLPEQKSHADSHILRVSYKTEEDRCSFIRVNATDCHDAFDYGRLTDISYVYGRLKTAVYCRRVKQNDDGRLKKKKNAHITLNKLLLFRTCITLYSNSGILVST